MGIDRHARRAGMGRKRLACAGLLLGLGLGMACSPPGDVGHGLGVERPNIVLVISDDHDFEHLGFMGSDLVHTPTLDLMAEQGLVFDTAYVPSSRCRPSLAALLSGRWPHQSGITTNQGGPRLDPTNALPQLLADAGYATYLGGKFWEGDPETFGFSAEYQSDKHSFVRKGQHNLFEFIDRFGGEQPLFIWWAPMLPHLPHDPPQRFLDLFDADAIPIAEEVPSKRVEEFRKSEHLSLAMEAWLDSGLEDLRTKLKSKKLLESTLFVFLIDNGYANGFASKGSAYEKGLRTPVMFSMPGTVPEGKRSRALVSTLDIYPTLLDFGGVKIPAGLEGRSLRGLIAGDESQARAALYGLQYEKIIQAGESPQQTAIALYARDARWKYILYLQDLPKARQRTETAFSAIKIREWRRGQEELFDLEQDPFERNSLHADAGQGARMQRMRSAAAAWLIETGASQLNLP